MSDESVSGESVGGEGVSGEGGSESVRRRGQQSALG